MLVQKELKNGFIGEYVEPRTPGANTIAYYNFDSQTLLNGATGTVDATRYSGGGSYATGYGGTGYCANITSGGPIALSTHIPTGDFTIAMCIKLDSRPAGNDTLWGVMGNEGLVGGRNHIQFNNNYFEYVQYNDGWFDITQIDTNALTLSADTWYRFYITRSGTDLKIYIDGTLVQSGTDLNYSYTTQSQTLYIGCAYSATNRKLPGCLDNVIIENRAWTQQEITKYDNGIS